MAHNTDYIFVVRHIAKVNKFNLQARRGSSGGEGGGSLPRPSLMQWTSSSNLNIKNLFWYGIFYNSNQKSPPPPSHKNPGSATAPSLSSFCQSFHIDTQAFVDKQKYLGKNKIRFKANKKCSFPVAEARIDTFHTRGSEKFQQGFGRR